MRDSAIHGCGFYLRSQFVSGLGFWLRPVFPPPSFQEIVAPSGEKPIPLEQRFRPALGNPVPIPKPSQR